MGVTAETGDGGAPPTQPSTQSSSQPSSQPGRAARTAAARRLAGGGAGTGALTRLVELTATLLESSAAQVSVVSDVQTVVAGAGLAAHAVGSEGPPEDSLCTVTVHEGGPLRVEDAAHDERVSGLPPVARGAVGSYLGVPLRAATGHVIGALCVFNPHPRHWSEEEVHVLEQLADPVVAEMELAALSADYSSDRVVWQLAVDAAGVGAFDWNLLTGELRWDDRLLELFGTRRDQFGGTIEAFNERVHPDDLPRVSAALERAIETCGTYEAEYRVVLPGGGTRWIVARGLALSGEVAGRPTGTAVRVFGAAYDTTAARDSDARVTHVLETMPSAFYSVDHEWRFTYLNAKAEELLQATRERLLGGVVWDLFPAARGSLFEESFRRAIETEQPVSFDAYYPAPLDGWFEVRAWPGPEGLSVFFSEISARYEAQALLQRVATRNSVLATVSAALSDTLETEAAVARLAPVIVDHFADWCLVSLVDDSHGDWRGRLRDVGWWHRDPGSLRDLERYAALRVPALSDDSYLAEAVLSDRPVIIPRGATERIAASLAPGEARDLIGRLAPDSFAAVQLRARGRTVGLLSLFRDAARGPLHEEELQTLLEVAARAGQALDNARVYARQKALAEQLQRSLLTEPPSFADLEVAVRYVPAAETAQVGGDWYDAFSQADGTSVLVIGDVVGHDTAAAAAMGQVRNMVRTIAHMDTQGPADILRGVDRVLHGLSVETTATAIVVAVERGLFHGRRMRWSNAGHPPPMLVGPDGSVTRLEAEESDLLLGFDPRTPRQESYRRCDPGATLLMFTDGLVERRGRPIEQGLDALESALQGPGVGGLHPEELCDLVLGAVPDRPEDDVAVLAVRFR